MDVTWRQQEICDEDAWRVSYPSLEVFKPKLDDLLAGYHGGDPESLGSLSEAPRQASPLIFSCGNTVGPRSCPSYEVKETTLTLA